jgi:hypothetical protein
VEIDLKQLDNSARAQLIEDTLASFGVDARVVQVNQGPTVTQFGVEPGWEIKTRTVMERDNRGLGPAHYLDDEYRRSLQAYVVDYLKEEVFDEGLTRNVAAFSRFFDAVGFSHGDLTNYAKSPDCGVDEDRGEATRSSSTPCLHLRRAEGEAGHRKGGEFYLFDVGARRHHRSRRGGEGEQFGRALSTVLMEILAHRSYRELGHGVHFWRTKSGLEVDFVLGDGEVAVEVKGTSRVDPSDLRSLRAFVEDNRPRRAVVVCNEPAPRLHDGIEVLPWREFLARLWGGKVI